MNHSRKRSLRLLHSQIIPAGSTLNSLQNCLTDGLRIKNMQEQVRKMGG